MGKIGEKERITQNRVIQLFQAELGYAYLNNWEERENNSNIEVLLLQSYLEKKGYNSVQINKAIYALQKAAQDFSDKLYTTNKKVYQLLRYGVDLKIAVGQKTEKVQFIDWQDWSSNHFAIAEEVTIKGQRTKRPDIVIYVNGIALGILELKRSTVSIKEAIRQSLGNQQDHFIQDFFATIQFIFAGNDTEGLRYGTIATPEKYYLQWKEDLQDNSRTLLDKYLLKMCRKDRFLEIIYDFVVFDGGIKKLPRVHQYFGVKAVQKHLQESSKKGGIIWHTQGSGKSITMVYLAKWILENNPNARVAIITDRDELDKQIQRVFEDVGESIQRSRSGKDLIHQLNQPSPRLLCSLVHKFGRKKVDNFTQFIKELESQPSQAVGDLFVFVDECHRTQSGRLHRTMKAILPDHTVFIGFTGTPLLKKDKQTSLEVFGKYIHTYKFNEGVSDGVILDLVYEARDIDQRITAPKHIDDYFEVMTEDLNDYQKSALKKRWGTKQKVLSSRSRMEWVVNDIVVDFRKKPRLKTNLGNAILVAHSIYEACRYYELFQRSPLKNKCAVVTSYNPSTKDITKEDTGANTETEKEFVYYTYKNLLGTKTTEQYEDWAKKEFSSNPAQMKLLIVVSKLLTGFDAPCCTFLYLDKSMQDHGLFQAICRVNRLHTEDKLCGYIVDYKDLFKKVENAVSVYTSDLDYDNFESKDIDIMLQDRLKADKERLDNALEALHILCEPVPPPRNHLDYIRYFCGNTELESDLKETAIQRNSLYKKTVSLIRAYANIKDEMEEVGYNAKAIQTIQQEVAHYSKLRETIKKASGEEIDYKSYEADMRYLIDTYIQADAPKTISPFGEMSLLEIITRSGISDAVNTLPDAIQNDPAAVAETIENNIRRTIINDFHIDPAFFEEMSKVLSAIVKERKEKAEDYADYLKSIAALIKKVTTGKRDDTPASLVTPAQRALYHNFGNDEALALQLHVAVKAARRDGWRGNRAKERGIKAAIHRQLASYYADITQENAPITNKMQEEAVSYNLEDEVIAVYKIVLEQKEY